MFNIKLINFGICGAMIINLPLLVKGFIQNCNVKKDAIVLVRRHRGCYGSIFVIRSVKIKIVKELVSKPVHK